MPTPDRAGLSYRIALKHEEPGAILRLFLIMNRVTCERVHVAQNNAISVTLV